MDENATGAAGDLIMRSDDDFNKTIDDYMERCGYCDDIHDPDFCPEYYANHQYDDVDFTEFEVDRGEDD